jgi:hypothetical protein
MAWVVDGATSIGLFHDPTSSQGYSALVSVIGHPSTLTIAFLTPIIHSHANIHFAILQYLLATPRNDGTFLSPHVISDEPQRKRVASLTPKTHASVTCYPMGKDDLFNAIRIPGDRDLMRSPPVLLSHCGGFRSLHAVLDPLVAAPEAHLLPLISDIQSIGLY